MSKSSASARALVQFQDADEHTRYFFRDIPDIVQKLDLAPVALAYCFQQIETGYRRLLYAGIMRRCRTDPTLTWDFVDRHDITRGNFGILFKAVFKDEVPQELNALIKKAQETRDKITHGKRVDRVAVWDAVSACLRYSNSFNQHLLDKQKFVAFGKLRGVTSSRSKPLLNKDISQLILRGLGFKAGAE